MGRIKGKICLCCGIPLSLDCFYKKADNLDGFYNKCKTCVREEHRIYREGHKEDTSRRNREYRKNHKEEITVRMRVYLKEYKRKHRQKLVECRQNHRKQQAESCRKYYMNNREFKAEYWKNYHLKNQHKAKAHHAVKMEIVKGGLTRPANCEQCGGGDREIYAHHPDYSKPLDVIWLCRICHYEIHRQLKEAACGI